jgi:hypothetical protein
MKGTMSWSQRQQLWAQVETALAQDRQASYQPFALLATRAQDVLSEDWAKAGRRLAATASLVDLALRD